MDLVETASHILDQILQELSVAQINAMIDKLFSWTEHVRIAHHLQEPQLANKLVGQISVTSVRYWKKMEHVSCVTFTRHLQGKVQNVNV